SRTDCAPTNDLRLHVKADAVRGSRAPTATALSWPPTSELRPPNFGRRASAEDPRRRSSAAVPGPPTAPAVLDLSHLGLRITSSRPHLERRCVLWDLLPRLGVRRHAVQFLEPISKDLSAANHVHACSV